MCASNIFAAVPWDLPTLPQVLQGLSGGRPNAFLVLSCTVLGHPGAGCVNYIPGEVLMAWNRINYAPPFRVALALIA